MPNLRKVWFAGAVSVLSPVGLMAQAQPAAPATPAPSPAAPAAAPVEEVGYPATDYFTFSAFTVSIPLRHDGVVPGSVKVDVDGKALTVGEDFWLNRDTGRVYFRKIPDAGQAVIVNYRYDPTLSTRKPEQNNLISGLGLGNGLFLSFSGDNVNGTPTFRSIGFSGLVGNGKTGVSGVALFTNRSGLGLSDIGSGGQSFDPSLTQGSDRLVLETLRAGALKLDYQDVSTGFTDFNSAADSGADPATMQRLMKERGLKRMGFSINDLQFGQGSISESFRKVSDGDDSINWRSLGIKQKTWTLNWTSRTINNDFWRFDDLAETDKDQLKNEAGLSRQSINGTMKAGKGNLSFNESDIVQQDGNGIHRQSLDYQGLYTFKAGRQSVGTGFNRFSSLPAPEQTSFSKEAGIDRQWADVAGPLGKSKFSFDKNDIGSTLSGMLRMTDYTLQSATYAFRHHERDVAQSFNAFGNLNDADLNFATDGIGKIFNPGYQPTPGDRAGFQRGLGLDRSGTRFDLTPGKWKASFATLKLNGPTDDALYEAMNIAAGKFTASMTHTSVGQNFNLASLMDFEHAALGNLAGLQRTDINAHFDATKGRTVDLQAMRASTDNGGASRTAFVLKDPKLELDLSARKVDAGFSNIGQMVDPENAWLSQLIGSSESEAKLKYQPNAKLHIEAWLANANGGPNQDVQGARDVSVMWNPDSKTALEMVRTDHTHDGTLGPILDRTYDHLAFRRDFGKYGKLGFVEERIVSDGSQKTETNSTKRSLTYQTKLTTNSSFALEETHTDFDDGHTETISSQTVSTKLTPKSGVSYTNTVISREGVGQKDERHDSYGAWVELKGGLKLEYGGARNLMDDAAGTKTTTFTASQATIGDVNFGGNYNENRYDGQHVAAQSRVSVSSAKPLRFGKLRDLKFTVASDTQADWTNYSRDNRAFGVSGKWGSSSFGYDYRSALDPASNERGIDRSILFATDPGETAKFRGSFSYKFRTLPGDQQAMIRNFSLTARPLPKMEITHQLMTNPELSRSDAVLGSVTQQARVNKWKLDYKGNPNFGIGGSFEESMHDGNQLSRVAGLTLTMNEGRGSPLSFFIGGEALDTINGRRAYSRYMLRYDPKEGENQKFSLFLGNMTYLHTFGVTGSSDSGLTFRVDYSIKF